MNLFQQPALIPSTLEVEEVSTSPAPLDTSSPILEEEAADLIHSQHHLPEKTDLVNTEVNLL